MGHDRLGTLPRTKSWTEVVELLDSNATSSQIAAKSMTAARRDLDSIKNDPVFRRTYWMLIKVTDAARHGDFVERLQELGLEVKEQPSFLEVQQALSAYLDEYRARSGKYTDAGEMGQFAAGETLADLVGPTLPSLFGATTADVQQAFRGLSRGPGFGRLSRGFLGRFLSRFLNYYLSRELSNHVGPGRAFTTVAEHAEFERALKTHCIQAARILEQFSHEWQSKELYEKGALTERDIGPLLHGALAKLSKELERG